MRRARGPGAARRRMILEAPMETPDDIGGVTRRFAPVATLWASLTPVAAAERREGGRMELAITHRVRMRWRPGVVAAMRLRLGARLFEIRGVHDEEERHRALVCQCEEIAP